MQRPIAGQLSIAVAIISLYWLQITVNFVPFYNGGITRLFVCLFFATFVAMFAFCNHYNITETVISS